MASRDHYTLKIECPNCHEKGMLHLSENDYPFMKKLDTTLKHVEGNFKAKVVKDDNVRVTCNNCGEIVK